MMRAPLLIVLLLLPILSVADDTVPTLMAQAQRAFVAGDFDTAKGIIHPSSRISA